MVKIRRRPKKQPRIKKQAEWISQHERSEFGWKLVMGCDRKESCASCEFNKSPKPSKRVKKEYTKSEVVKEVEKGRSK